MMDYKEILWEFKRNCLSLKASEIDKKALAKDFEKLKVSVYEAFCL